MKENDCEYEPRTRSIAIGRGRDEDLERHVAGCPKCSESMMLLGRMQTMAGQTAAPQNLPAAGLLLFKARLLDKQSAAKRAVRPIFWMKLAAPVVGVLGLVFLWTSGGPQVGSIISKTIGSFAAIAPLAVLAIVGAILFCLTAALFFREPKRKKRAGGMFQLM